MIAILLGYCTGLRTLAELSFAPMTYRIDAVTSSGILKVKQKLSVTFNFIDLMKFSKMTMCRPSEANSEK